MLREIEMSVLRFDLADLAIDGADAFLHKFSSRCAWNLVADQENGVVGFFAKF